MTQSLHLLAHVAGRAVAIDALQVASVVDIAATVPVPRVAAAVRGLAALRSTVVTVVDSRAALGLAPGPDTGRAVVTRMDGHDYAILVDSLEDVAPFAVERADRLAASGAWAAVGSGIVERDGKPLLVVDLHALLATLAAN